MNTFVMDKQEYENLMRIIISGCKFRYFSYDHNKAMIDYSTQPEYETLRKWIPKPSCWEMPQGLISKYKTEKIGKLREIHFARDGKAWRFKIGSKYSKTFFLRDFGVNVFPLIDNNI